MSAWFWRFLGGSPLVVEFLRDHARTNGLFALVAEPATSGRVYCQPSPALKVDQLAITLGENFPFVSEIQRWHRKVGGPTRTARPRARASTGRIASVFASH